MEEIAALRKEKEVKIFENNVGEDDEDEEGEKRPSFTQATSMTRDTQEFNDVRAKNYPV